MPRRSVRDTQDGTTTIEVFDREDFFGSVPWIAVVPTSAKIPCDAIKGSAPLYAIFKMSRREDTDPEHAAQMQAKREAALLKHQCKKNAHWVYVFENGAIKRFCTDHLYAHGVWGYMEERDRLTKWVEEHYKAVKTDPQED